MPVMKKKDGYYWGSKGPFKTRAKAEQVGRAAYANGYKGKSNGSKKTSTKKKASKR